VTKELNDLRACTIPRYLKFASGWQRLSSRQLGKSRVLCLPRGLFDGCASGGSCPPIQCWSKHETGFHFDRMPAS
jgi:hypothetical protein